MNLIGGHHQISQENGVLSLVVNPKTGHGFIVIEFLDAEGKRANIEAHLGHKLTDGNLDDSKCGIHLMQAPAEKLNKIHSSFSYRSWPVTPNDIDTYIMPKIKADRERCNTAEGMNYTKFVTTENSWTGIGGDIFDLFSKELKEEAIRSLNASTPSNASTESVQHSVIASLDNDPNRSNCLKWAVATACAIPFINLSIKQPNWNKYVILMPKNAIPDADQLASDLQNLDGPGGTRACRLI